MALKHLLLAFAVALLASFSAFSQESPVPSDTQAYLNVLEDAKDQSLPQQIETWRLFLSEHPNSPYQPEIEKNLQILEKLLLNTDPERKKEAQDTEIYLRAVEFSKRLSTQDRIDLWHQFLDEHPDNLFRPDVENVLRELERRHSPRRTITPTAKPHSPLETSDPRAPVVLDLNYKNENRAILYATFVGLLVPGMGHWYTEDYVIAGVLTGLRVAAIAIGVPAVMRNSQALYITSGVLAGFSYLVDVADTPFSVRRYNEALEQTQATRYKQGSIMFSFAF